MSDRTNHRRVLHFAVTGMLLGGAVGCTSNEPAKDAKGESKTDGKQPSGRVIVNQDPVDPPEPEEVKLAPNPGPNDPGGSVPPAPDTKVKPEVPPVEPIEEDHVNEGPVEEPEELKPVNVNEGPQDRAPIEKRVNTQRVAEPLPAPKTSPLKVNPGPEG